MPGLLLPSAELVALARSCTKPTELRDENAVAEAPDLTGQASATPWDPAPAVAQDRLPRQSTPAAADAAAALAMAQVSAPGKHPQERKR